MSASNPRKIALEVLERIDRTQAYAEILIDHVLQRPMAEEDKSLCTELVYGTLRWRSRLEWILRILYHGRYKDIPIRIRLAFLIGIYQILFLDRIPGHAAVNESVQLAKDSHGTLWSGRVNAVLRELIRHPDKIEYPSVEKDPLKAISVRWSHPEWLVQHWLDRFGVQRTISICKANNQRPCTTLRMNSIRMKGQDKCWSGLGFQVQVSEYLEEFAQVRSSGVPAMDLYQDGWFSIQDTSAGLVSHLMDPQIGERIVDLAASPGGKAAHMAELTGDSALILAGDKTKIRIKKIIENQKRLRLSNIVPILMDGRHPAITSADKVLVDAPCSGLGTIRRHGELRWRRPDFSGLSRLQNELLEAGSRIVKPGGILVYSTCTILPEENQDRIHAFLKKRPGFKIEDAKQWVDSRLVEEGMIQTWPDLHGVDGSFAVRLRNG